MRRRSTVGGALEMFSLPLPLAVSIYVDQYNVVYGLSNGATFNNLERPLAPISRSRHYLTLSISGTAKVTAVVAIEGK